MTGFNSRFRADTKISKKRFLFVALLISSALAWFFLVNYYFLEIFKNLGVDDFWAHVGQTVFYGFGAFSALLGGSIGGRIERRTLIGSWTILGIVVTALMASFQGVILSLVLSVLLGFSLGFGFPSITSFLADSTEIEERGRVAGLVILTAFILTFSGIAIAPMLGSRLWGILLVCSIVRFVGVYPLILDKFERRTIKESSWAGVATQKNFILYLVPWLLFNVAAGLLDWSGSSISQTPEFAAAVSAGTTIGYVCTAFSGILAGSIADRFGRKQPIVVALVLMGISFALLSYAQIPQTILIHYTVYGIAWGFLFALYLTIPGDVANSVSNVKFYALGTASWLIAFASLTVIPELFTFRRIPPNVLAPILSAIIFLSIVPVLRAKETLPASKINARKMKDHIEKVGKLIEESKEEGQSE